MSEEKKGITRREFISKGIKGVGLVGLGGAIGLTASRFLRREPDRRLNSAGSYLPEFDPALISYKEVGRINTGFGSLRAVTVGPHDQIYLAADNTVRIFGRDATPLLDLKLGDSPGCLTVTENGDVYVGMRNHVEVYSPKGLCKANWDNLGQNSILTSIDVSENNVFVADAGNRMVLKYDASGRMIRRIGERTAFSVPSPYFDVKVSPDGLLRIANPGEHRVEAYTPEGNYEFSWGDASMDIDGFCGCCNPANFDVLPDGRFVTCEKGVPRVKIYNAKGEFESVVAGSEAFAVNAKSCSLNGLSDCRTGGMDVATDSQGRVIVMDPVERTVRIFAPIEKV